MVDLRQLVHIPTRLWTDGLLGIMLLVAVAPWEMLVIIPGLGTLTRLMGGIAVLNWLLSRAPKDPSWHRTAFTIPWLLLLGWTTASYSWSIAPERTFGGLGTLLQLAVLMWIVGCTVTTPRAFRLFGASLACGGLVLAIATIADASTGASLTGSPMYRAAPGEANPNTAALNLVYCLVATVSLLAAAVAARNNRAFVLLSCTAAVMGWALLLTGSRTGALAALIGTIVVIGLSIRMTVRSYAYLVVGAVFVSSLALLNSVDLIALETDRVPPTWQRLAIPQPQALYEFGDRVPLWQVAGTVDGWRSMVGVGWNASPEQVRQVLRMTEGQSLHNLPVTVYMELGAVGAALLGFILLGLIGQLLSRRRETAMVLALLATIAVNSLTESGMDKKLWWVAVALAAVAATRSSALRLLADPRPSPIHSQRTTRTAPTRLGEPG